MQVLAKSCKMIPVMVMGTLVGGKRYSVIEYVCVGLIAGGISLFAAQVRTHRLAEPGASLCKVCLCMSSCRRDAHCISCRTSQLHKVVVRQIAASRSTRC